MDTWLVTIKSKYELVKSETAPQDVGQIYFKVGDAVYNYDVTEIGGTIHTMVISQITIKDGNRAIVEMKAANGTSFITNAHNCEKVLFFNGLVAWFINRRHEANNRSR